MQTDEEKNSAAIRKVLRKKLQAYFKETLEPLGFVQEKRSSYWSRSAQTLFQWSAYEFPRSHFVRIWHSYNFTPSYESLSSMSQDSQTQKMLASYQQKLIERFRFSVSNGSFKDWKVPSSMDKIDALLTEVDVFFTEEVLPFHNKYQDGSEILFEYDSGNIGDKYINMTGEPWVSFNLAVLRYQEGKYAETLELFQKYLLSIEEDRKRDESWEMLASGVELAVDSLKKRLNQNDGN